MRPQPSGASIPIIAYGAYRPLWKFLPLWCSILCCASLALRCHCSVPLFQHSPQIHRKEESRLFLLWVRKHRLLYWLHNLSGVAQRILPRGSAPNWDVCHAPGDCGNWSPAVCEEIWVLRIKNLSLNPISVWNIMICYFFMFCFVITPTLEVTVEGIFLIKVIVSSRSNVLDWAKNPSNPFYCVAKNRSQGSSVSKYV